MGFNEIQNLNSKEKIILMNKIWDSIDKENELVETPKWHKEILTTRISKMKKGEAKTISLAQLKNR